MLNQLPSRPGHQVPAEDIRSADVSPSAWPSPVLPGLADERIDWRRYLATVWRYKWLVVLVTLLGTAVAVAGSRFIAPEYEAQATIWIEAQRRSDARQGPIQSSELLESSAWVDLLKSYVVLDHVVRDQRLYLGLESPQDSLAFTSFQLGDRFAPGRYRLQVSENGGLELKTRGGRQIDSGPPGEALGERAGFTWVPTLDTLTPGGTIDFEVGNPRDIATSLGRDIAARMDLNGNFLRLGLTGSDPERLAVILNAVAERYVDVAAELKRAKLEELKDILDEQLRYAWQNLEEAEAALERFRVQTITLPSEPATPVAPGLEMTRDPAFQNYFSLKVEEEQLRRDREALERALVQAPDSGVSVEALEVIPAVRTASELLAALEELTNKRAELRALRRRYSEEYPAVRELAREVESLERRTVLTLVSDLKDEIDDREAELARLIASASGELSQIPPRAIEEARLERRVEIAENLYTMLQARYEEARLAAASSIPDVRILDAAITPYRPINQQDRPRLVLMAFMGSLGLGLLGAILLDRIDPRFKYPEQISRELGLSVLGTIPHVSQRGEQLGIQNTSEAVEAFRVVRLNLLHAHGTAGPVVVAVTSPSPEDGKSFVVANLGLAFADLGRRTLVIDADVRQGRLHRLLNGSRKPGLTDHLAGRADVEQVVQRTPFGRLHCIASGTRRHHAPELLQSPVMPALLAQLRSRYEVILIDTPPLSAGVDPLALGTVTGNLIVVLRTGATDRQLTETKLDVLDALPIRVLGAVLNDVPASPLYHRYRYYTSGYETWDEEPVTEAYRELGSVVEPQSAGEEGSVSPCEESPDATSSDAGRLRSEGCDGEPVQRDDADPEPDVTCEASDSAPAGGAGSRSSDAGAPDPGIAAPRPAHQPGLPAEESVGEVRGESGRNVRAEHGCVMAPTLVRDLPEAPASDRGRQTVAEAPGSNGRQAAVRPESVLRLARLGQAQRMMDMLALAPQVEPTGQSHRLLRDVRLGPRAASTGQVDEATPRSGGRTLVIGSTGAVGGNGPRPSGNHSSNRLASLDSLDLHARDRLDLFRQHQRQTRLRYWKKK